VQSCRSRPVLGHDGAVNESPTPNLIPAVDPLPDALFGGADVLEDDADFESFWSRLLPEDMISLTPEGPVAESVVVERAAPVSAEDLALNYGDDFVPWEQASRWCS